MVRVMVPVVHGEDGRDVFKCFVVFHSGFRMRPFVFGERFKRLRNQHRRCITAVHRCRVAVGVVG